MIGIIGAMDEEVNELKAGMEEVKVTTKASMEFYEGTIAGLEIGDGNNECFEIVLDNFWIRGNNNNTSWLLSLNRCTNIYLTRKREIYFVEFFSLNQFVNNVIKSPWYKIAKHQRIKRR